MNGAVAWGRALCVGMLGLSLLALLTASSGARSLAVAPVFGSPKAVVPFTADDVGGASEMESSDLNGDGLADVVVTRITYPPAHITHPIGIFLADGHGGFTDGSSMWDGPPSRTEWGRQIIIADFNGDHRNDIFVADHGYDAPPFPGHANELALSTPQGKLVDASANLPPESGFSHSAAAADVNGDGSVDIFVGNLCTACTPDAQPEVLLNDVTGHFTRRTDPLPADLQDADGAHRYTRSLFVDVNADGAPDLVLGADNNTTNSRVLLNDRTGHFHDAPAPLPPKPLGPTSILISLATLDINHDGRPDLLAGFTPGDPFYVGRRIQVLINNGDGTFRDETAQRLAEQDSGQGWPYAFRMADFNGDGHLDFTVDVNHYPVEHAPIYLDDGSGVYHEVPFSAAAQLFAIADANGDRHPDIFSTSAGGGGGPEQHFVQLEIVAPAAPRGLRAVGRRNGIDLSWNGVPGATSYRSGLARSANQDTTAHRHNHRATLRRPPRQTTHHVHLRHPSPEQGRHKPPKLTSQSPPPIGLYRSSGDIRERWPRRASSRQLRSSGNTRLPRLGYLGARYTAYHGIGSVLPPSTQSAR